MIRVDNLHAYVPDERDRVEVIDRKTMWGNPYHISAKRTRWEAVLAYLDYAREEFDKQSLLELDGCTLLCHCAPALCHGNALQLVVNELKGRTRQWVLVTGEAPRRTSPIPPEAEAGYKLQIAERLGRLPSNAVVVHGGAQGVDTWADEYAMANNLDVVRWPADWSKENREKSGRNPGPQRNQFMLDAAPIDNVLAFHRDIRRSAGTKDMLSRAQSQGYEWELCSQIEIFEQGALWDGPIGGSGSP